ncbi:MULTISPECIES: hypothetical protein [Pseudomonadaceae]|uniref:Uncharacterized protein n=1 Tax=Stutzerimonas stutzeri TaxID=316 RepID=A0ABD4XW74_STUST|nr:MULTISPECIES: hypothetical protein [Pseudomonadaceae]MDH0687108.1 hypothetical protein [Stutzerimonas stutzeri]MDS9628962.1 hypothetical protein [Pseudomonas aeruginosa]
MRIETQERTKRLDGAAKLLLGSQESAEVKAEVALQINVYHTILAQLEGSPDHTQDMAKVVEPIDEFCTLTERTFAAARSH